MTISLAQIGSNGGGGNTQSTTVNVSADAQWVLVYHAYANNFASNEFVSSTFNGTTQLVGEAQANTDNNSRAASILYAFDVSGEGALAGVSVNSVSDRTDQSNLSIYEVVNPAGSVLIRGTGIAGFVVATTDYTISLTTESGDTTLTMINLADSGALISEVTPDTGQVIVGAGVELGTTTAIAGYEQAGDITSTDVDFTISNSYDGTLVGIVLYDPTGSTVTGPTTMVDGDSVTVTGTNFSSPTLDLVDSNSLYIAPQIVDSSTTTTIEVLSVDDGDLNLVAGSPQSGIPKSVVDDSAIGTTPYVIRALVDSTFTGPSIDYSASSDYWVIQTMASSADTSVGSFFDPLKIAVEDNMQLAIPKVISGVNTILYDDGSFEIDQDVVVAIPGIYFSPSTGQYSLHTMVTGEAVAGIVETCYDVDGVILPNGTSVTWAVYPNVAGLQSGGVLASGVTEITGGDGTLFINDPNVGIVDDIVLLAAVLPDDTTVMDIAVTVKDIGE